MRLSDDLVRRTVSQFDAQAIPETHPAMTQLSEMFGDHTFFLDGNGLHVVEPLEVTEAGLQKGKVVKLASWIDPDQTSLAPHRPEITDVTVILATEH
jgi:hypothetical protein